MPSQEEGEPAGRWDYLGLTRWLQIGGKSLYLAKSELFFYQWRWKTQTCCHVESFFRRAGRCHVTYAVALSWMHFHETIGQYSWMCFLPQSRYFFIIKLAWGHGDGLLGRAGWRGDPAWLEVFLLLGCAGSGWQRKAGRQRALGDVLGWARDPLCN